MSNEKNMSAVDVLAVIRREKRAAGLECDRASGRGGKDLNRLSEKQADAVVARMERAASKRRARWDEAVAAEFAVAELIEAAAKLVNRPGIAGLCGDDEIRLRAALARVGGGK